MARVVATETQAMVGPEEILTERLRLRPPTESDAERIFGATAKTREVSRYMSWKPHRSIDDTLAFLAPHHRRQCSRPQPWGF